MLISTMTVPDPADPAGLSGVFDDVATAAAAGFPRIWMPQMPPEAGLAGWDALTALALAGARTPGVDLGTAVTVAYTQHPLALARQALTASAAVQGRLLLGVGVSHRFLVSDMLGYSYEAPAAYLREYLEVLGPALAGAAVDHHGRRITAVGRVDAPGAPPPQLIAAALGPRMLEIAGRLTDGTITAWTGLKTVAQQIVPGITTAAEAAGRPAPQVIVGLPIAVTNDVDAARAEIDGMFSPGDLPAYRAVLDVEGVDGVADICVFGDERQVAAQLQRFAEAGATEFAAHLVGDAATVARTTEVLAAIRASASG